MSVTPTLMTRKTRVFFFCLVGFGAGLHLSALSLTPASGVFWLLTALTTMLSVVFIGIFLGNSEAASRLEGSMLGKPKKIPLADVVNLGGESLGLLERTQIPSLLLQLNAASRKAHPEVRRVAVDMQDASQDLLARLTEEPNAYVAAREGFAHRVPAVVDALNALNDVGLHERELYMSKIIDSMASVAAGIRKDQIGVSGGQDHKLQTALDKLDAGLSAWNVNNANKIIS